MVVNTPSGSAARLDGYEIRAATTSMDRPIITTVQQLAAAVAAIETAIETLSTAGVDGSGPARVRSLQEHARSLGRLSLRAVPPAEASTGDAAEPSAGDGVEPHPGLDHLDARLDGASAP
jgi:carbamoyl-phosphate synthase large subunit